MLSTVESSGAKTARVLVVDDDPITLTLLEQVLRSHGYEVVGAASGEDALLAAQSAPPDIVLLDVMLPGIDGFATCERMRQMDPLLDVPIVMLTGADDYAAIDRAFAAQATDFISKPFQWRLLLQRVRYALRTGRLTRERRLDRLHQIVAHRLARLIFFHWDLDQESLAWSDDHFPFPGASVPTPSRVPELLELVMPHERQRVAHAIGRTRDHGEPLDVELPLHVEGEAFIVRLVGEVGAGGGNQRVVSGALQAVT